MTKQELINEVTNLVSSKYAVTLEVKQKLFDMGFKLIEVGAKKELEINSKDIKIDFIGYDIAIGLAARAVSYGCRRFYYALAIKLEK